MQRLTARWLESIVAWAYPAYEFIIFMELHPALYAPRGGLIRSIVLMTGYGFRHLISSVFLSRASILDSIHCVLLSSAPHFERLMGHIPLSSCTSISELTLHKLIVNICLVRDTILSFLVIDHFSYHLLNPPIIYIRGIGKSYDHISLESRVPHGRESSVRKHTWREGRSAHRNSCLQRTCRKAD